MVGRQQPTTAQLPRQIVHQSSWRLGTSISNICTLHRHKTRTYSGLGKAHRTLTVQSDANGHSRLDCSHRCTTSTPNAAAVSWLPTATIGSLIECLGEQLCPNIYEGYPVGTHSPLSSSRRMHHKGTRDPKHHVTCVRCLLSKAQPMSPSYKLRCSSTRTLDLHRGSTQGLLDSCKAHCYNSPPPSRALSSKRGDLHDRSHRSRPDLARSHSDLGFFRTDLARGTAARCC